MHLAAYEAGYKAGWDDAITSQDDDRRRISSDFASNLTALSFTYEEALQAMLRDIRPVLDEIVGKILPELAHRTLAPRVAEQLHEVLRNGAGAEVEIVVAPDDLPAIEGLLDDPAAMPVTLSTEPTLGPGQVSMRFGGKEREIDIGGLLEDIASAMDGFFDAVQGPDQKETA
ncbi:hypothetical protein K1T73_01300 [Roseovarius sp. SCSIO 43702]|uniref:hypothetical protein n=1 Tax=Roseovarius sp. SCSIO 43702 TaxID=2823043 RepID=UPI001C73DE28|nr:hypothetical protein [Roseovarius sp. SCSIO 43702]QYX57081.1 hypothetical protein K1T73_01300 [Roseovarius sp. SCSIO 43702]